MNVVRMLLQLLRELRTLNTTSKSRSSSIENRVCSGPSSHVQQSSSGDSEPWFKRGQMMSFLSPENLSILRVPQPVLCDPLHPLAQVKPQKTHWRHVAALPWAGGPHHWLKPTGTCVWKGGTSGARRGNTCQGLVFAVGGRKSILGLWQTCAGMRRGGTEGGKEGAAVGVPGVGEGLCRGSAGGVGCWREQEVQGNSSEPAGFGISRDPLECACPCKGQLQVTRARLGPLLCAACAHPRSALLPAGPGARGLQQGHLCSAPQPPLTHPGWALTPQITAHGRHIPSAATAPCLPHPAPGRRGCRGEPGRAPRPPPLSPGRA